MAGGRRASTDAPGAADASYAPAMPHHVVLVGLMGSGKTTVGSVLATRLGLPFVDSDVEIERAAGRDAAAIAAADGVPALVALEARVLLAALAEPGRDVIAAAASVVDDVACRCALREPEVAVIRLRARPITLASRHAAGAHRRPLGDDLVAGFATQVRTRAPRFAAVRPLVTIDVDGHSPEVVVEAALDALAHGRDGCATATTPIAPARREPRQP